MIDLVGNQYDEPSDPNTILYVNFVNLAAYFLQVVSPRAYSLLGALAALIGGLTAPAAPIVLPIVASLFLVKWIYDVYEQSYVFLSMSC